MRSLPERFEPKVTALEENDTYKEMKPSEVIGRLLAYESRKATTSPPKKKKNLALKTSKVEKEEDDSYKDPALFIKRFKKLAMIESKGVGSRGQDLKKKGVFNQFEPRQEKTERKEIQC